MAGVQQPRPDQQGFGPDDVNQAAPTAGRRSAPRAISRALVPRRWPTGIACQGSETRDSQAHRASRASRTAAVGQSRRMDAKNRRAAGAAQRPCGHSWDRRCSQSSAVDNRSRYR